MLSLFAVFALGCAAEWVGSTARGSHHAVPATAADEIARMYSGSGDEEVHPAARRKAARPMRSVVHEGALNLLAVTLHFAIMLLAMTYNVGVFIAVVLGVAVTRTRLRS